MTKNLLLIVPKLKKLQNLLRDQNNDYMYQTWSRTKLVQQIEISKYESYTSWDPRGLSSDDLKFWNKVYTDLTKNKA